MTTTTNKKGNALYHVAASGFYVYRPMSPSVAWHRNGCDEGSIAVVYPISKMTTECRTPIEAWPNSHTAKAALKDGSDKIDPHLKRGDVLLVDNRTPRMIRKARKKAGMPFHGDAAKGKDPAMFIHCTCKEKHWQKMDANPSLAKQRSADGTHLDTTTHSHDCISIELLSLLLTGRVHSTLQGWSTGP